MRFRFHRLLALARRMVPGAFIDPATPVGDCRYCDAPVVHADGDLDAEGRARHSACERAVTKRHLDRMSADRLFFHVLGLVRDLPTVQPRAKAAVRALPERHDARDMAAAIDAMLPSVETEPALSLRARRDTVVALRDAKRTLLGLGRSAGNETRPS